MYLSYAKLTFDMPKKAVRMDISACPWGRMESDTPKKRWTRVSEVSKRQLMITAGMTSGQTVPVKLNTMAKGL
jgi:hypothetical protein